jgi:hypothetical protein
LIIGRLGAASDGQSVDKNFERMTALLAQGIHIASFIRIILHDSFLLQRGLIP